VVLDVVFSCRFCGKWLILTVVIKVTARRWNVYGRRFIFIVSLRFYIIRSF